MQLSRFRRRLGLLHLGQVLAGHQADHVVDVVDRFDGGIVLQREQGHPMVLGRCVPQTGRFHVAMVPGQRFDVLGDQAEFRIGDLRGREHRHEAQGRAGLPFHLTGGVPSQTRRNGAALSLGSVTGAAAVDGE